MFQGDRPMELHPSAASASKPTKTQRDAVHQVGQTVRAYLKETEALLQGQYSGIKDWAPNHLSNPGNVLVVVNPDGVVIRFEGRTAENRVVAGWMAEPLAEVVSTLSQRLIHCYEDRNFTSTVLTTGMEIRLGIADATTGEERDFASARIGFDAVIERPERMPAPPHKPFCLLSVRNSFEIGLQGILLENQSDSVPEGREFLVRSMMRLPVGWECIEVYPFLDIKHWNPRWAAVWAENDILASVVAHQQRENYFVSLDPNAAARRRLGAVLENYRKLLESGPNEEALQRFLRDQPALLCPSHVRAWPKLDLGARQTDFVFRKAAGDYLLVELEKPSHRLFIKSGDSSQQLNHAVGQILDWKRYLEDNLATVQRELGLTSISANPSGLIVIGRSESLTPEHRRKLVAIENQSPKIRIMTYDDVYDDAKAVIENLLGPIWEVVGNTEIYYLPPNTGVG